MRIEVSVALQIILELTCHSPLKKKKNYLIFKEILETCTSERQISTHIRGFMHRQVIIVDDKKINARNSLPRKAVLPNLIKICHFV
jgi:hypothetical protein